MIEYIALLLTGFLGLWYSADRTVDNAEEIVKALGIPGFMFGVVFISISTGLPEIATAIISAFEGVPELSAGDTIGSSFVNLTFVLGVTILAGRGLQLGGEDLDLIRDAVLATIAAASILLFFQSLVLAAVGSILIVYGIFLLRVEHSAFQLDDDGSVSTLTVLKTLLGIAALLISARLMVVGAKGLGEVLGVPIELLGATVVAVGTGLPELAFEISAVRKGDISLALGDIFGSTLVNITLTISVLGLISTPSLTALTPVLLGLIAIGMVALAFSWKGDFSMLEGSVLLIIFMAYITFQIL
jgi:cation:H+ antiporter